MNRNILSSLEPLFSKALASPHYMTQCSPQRRLEDKQRNGFDISCFNDSELDKLINDYNDSVNEYRRIPLGAPFEQKRNLLLRHTNCDSDACLLGNATSQALKPKGHLGWLSNFDIQNILKQFESIIPSFKFYDAVGCDYYDVYPREFPSDVTRYAHVAWVFNTDRIHQSGKHWVAVYVNNNEGTVEYFDSVGKEPNKYIKKFIQKYFGNYSYSWNRIQHQKEDNECGIYSVYWILARLHGDSVAKRITDKQMHYFRAAVFR